MVWQNENYVELNNVIEISLHFSELPKTDSLNSVWLKK